MKNQDGFVAVLAAIIITAILVGGGVYYMQQAKVDTAVEDAVTKVANEASSEVGELKTELDELKEELDTENEWLTYINEEFGFSLKLPSTWDGYYTEAEDDSISFGLADDRGLFYIMRFEKTEWEEWQEIIEQGDTKQIGNYIDAKDDYVFAYAVTADNVDLNLKSDINNDIIKTFKFLADTSDWQTYTNEEYKYSIQYPSDWSIDSDRTTGDDNVVFDNDCAGECREAIGVVESTQSLEAFQADLISDESVIEQKVETTIDSQEALHIYTTEFAIQYIITKYDDHIYTFTTQGAMADDGVLDTFKFLADTSDWMTYTNEEYKFSLDYPSTYTLENKSIGVELVRVFSGNPPDDMGGRHIVRVDFLDGNGSDVDNKLYDWAIGGFIEEMAGYFDKDDQVVNGSDFAVFDVASGMDDVVEYFLIRDDKVLRIYSSLLGHYNESLNQDIINSFVFFN